MFVHVPCKSGSPPDVLGGVQDFGGGDGEAFVWATLGVDAASARKVASAIGDTGNRWLMLKGTVFSADAEVNEMREGP
jgi:hypothetical protein